MAGILANSAAHTMVSGDTSPSDVESGYVTGQQVTLTTFPTGTTYVWGLAIPAGSASARSGLSSATAASPTFTPDVAGEYVVTCVVNGSTSYVIRCSVAAVAATNLVGAIRFMPMTDSSVPTPSTGVSLYYSSTQSALAIKDANGDVSTVDVTAV